MPTSKGSSKDCITILMLVGQGTAHNIEAKVGFLPFEAKREMSQTIDADRARCTRGFGRGRGVLKRCGRG